MAAARRSPQRKFAIMVGRQSTPNFGFCLKRERANTVLRSLFALLRPGDKFNVQSLGDEGARAAAAAGADSGGGDATRYNGEEEAAAARKRELSGKSR